MAISEFSQYDTNSFAVRVHVPPLEHVGISAWARYFLYAESSRDSTGYDELTDAL